ncbi:MAG: hypothetical protein CMM37_13080 [Rhodospirillaceae bacterium]|nr:hypothetical protein [Rhodospirillaceae bacterium]
MIATDKSVIITFAVPVFLILILIEYVYGIRIGKNNYRLSDTFTSLGLGLISRFPPMLNLGFQGAVFVYVGIYFNLDLLSSKSIWTWLIAFVFYDFLYYWMHRMHHEIKVLWATHSVHHHGEEFNLSTALRQTSTGWLWKWIFYLPMIVIGIPAQVFVTVAGINLVYQFWVHTKHIGHLGIFEKIFVTPMNHGIHHAKNPEYIDANYGGVFIFWDRIFGTYIAEQQDVKPIYGTVKPLRSWNPVSANFQVFHQMVYDTVYTKKLSNKLKVWYGPTHWRPEDVVDNEPILDTLKFDEKFNPSLNIWQKVFAIIQLFSIVIFAGILATSVSEQSYQETWMYGVVLVLAVLLTSLILENKSYALSLHFFSSYLLLFLLCVGSVFNSGLLATQFLVFYATTNAVFLTLVIVVKRLGINQSFDKAVKQD